MQTYSIPKGQKAAIAFEIEHVYVSIHRIAEILARVAGVTVVRSTRAGNRPDDVRLRFRFHDIEFMVWEPPLGDNSRYWIGPVDLPEGGIDIEPLRDAFELYVPHPAVRIFGAVLTLNFRALLPHR